jgi:separase
VEILPKRLSFYLYFASGANHDREEHLTQAHKIFERTAEASGSTSRDNYKTIQLLSDMNYISSLLAVEKGQYSKAFLHARAYVRLSYRAWTTIELRQSKNLAIRLLGDEASESDVDDVTNQMSTLLLAKPIKSPIVSPKFAMLQSPAFWSTVRRLFHALMHLSQLFAHWGLFPEARYYIEQGLKTVEAAQAPCLKSQALGLLGAYLTRNGDVEKGIDLLKQAEKLRHGLHVDPFTVSLHVFKANYYTYTKDKKSASEAFNHAIRLIEQLVSNSMVKEPTVETNAEQDLNAEMAQLSTHERPSAQRLQTKKRVASKLGGSKPTSAVKATTFRRDAQCISILSRLRGSVLRQQASMATSMDKFELAASLLCEAANSPGTPQDLMFNNLGAGQLQLRQAIEAMAADPIFCVLPESTTSQPCISAVRGRQGTSAPERSPKKKTLASPPRRTMNKGASRATRVEHATPPNQFPELLGQAHENILSVYEQAKAACSTATIHSLTDLLTKTLVMLSASTASQAKGVASSLFALYVMGKRWTNIYR